MRKFLITTLAAPVIVAGAVQGCDGSDGSEFTSNGNQGGDASCSVFGCSSTGEGGRPGCVGTECAVVDCGARPTKTTLTGTVFDPAGKVPLYNVVVYVARTTPEPITLGLGPKCDTCAASVSGGPFAITTTDTKGDFRLEDIPAGVDFDLVVQIGKWRRIVRMPAVKACEVAAADPTLTRLPRNRTEGDIPRIALTTGSADALECLLKKVGLDDTEFGPSGSEARVHLYEGGSHEDGTRPGTERATKAFQSGPAFTKALTLWNNVAELKKYDVVMLACEGAELPETIAAPKPESARRALYDYAKVGGRLFTSHYHHYWFSNSPIPEVKGLAKWTNDGTCTGTCDTPNEFGLQSVNATVSTKFAKAAAMKEWLRNTQSLTGPGETLPIQEGRHNVDSVTKDALSWMTITNPNVSRAAHEYITFNTPVGASDAEVCGRVVYSDLHVGAGDKPGAAFPSECQTTDLTPQQKALEFMLFDLSSCIQKDDQPPVLPR